jgi:glycosyltransferase involved in cell wall biosynthesis
VSIAVVQIGARMHYAVPRILHRAGVLHRLFTDLCATKGWPRLLHLLPRPLRPGIVRNALARCPDGVPRGRIVSFPLVGLRYFLRLRGAREPAAEAAAHLSVGRELGERVLRHGFGSARAIYAMNSAAAQVFRPAHSLGIATIYEQTIAPVRVEWELLREEFARWPEWEDGPDLEAFYSPFAALEKEEWDLSDRIVCGSKFVRDKMGEIGGPVDRCVVVPYGVDQPPLAACTRLDFPTDRRWRVLIVGTVTLRKGAPYVAASAAALGTRAEFRWVGPIRLAKTGRRRLAEHVELTGAVPRHDVGNHYRWADLFLLPSICEGSATAVYEALSYRLPVIVTPNTGAPIQTGFEGVLVPIRDSNAIVRAVELLMTDLNRFRAARTAAAARAQALTLECYGQALLTALRDWTGTK